VPAAWQMPGLPGSKAAPELLRETRGGCAARLDIRAGSSQAQFKLPRRAGREGRPRKKSVSTVINPGAIGSAGSEYEASGVGDPASTTFSTWFMPGMMASRAFGWPFFSNSASLTATWISVVPCTISTGTSSLPIRSYGTYLNHETR
jgi:hypothetical protein